MLFQEDPTEEKPDNDTVDQEQDNGNSNGSSGVSEPEADTLTNGPEEQPMSTVSQSEGIIKLEKDVDADDDGLVLDEQELEFPDSNGHALSPKNGVLQEENESSGDFNPKIESVATVDGQEQTEIGVRVTQLEKEVNSLECLLASKELEWNAILRLKKLKELLLEQLRRESDIASILGQGETKDLQSLTKECLLLEGKSIDNMDSESKAFTSNIKSEISKMELEITEVRGNRFQRLTQKVAPMSLDHRNASLALKQLSEKNSAELKQGRNGPIVPVTTLIADYRAKRKLESPVLSRKRSRPSKAQIQPTSTISYSDVLVSLAKISSSEHKSSDVTLNSNSTPVSTPKATARGNSAVNKSNITLAKLLSTSGGTPTGSHRPDDNKSNDDFKSSRHVNNSGSNPDTSISLSNLLASNNKARNDTSQKAESIPICQGCSRNQAQFVCAGCGSQWYCSRECQVEAWDDHAESCSG